MKKVLAFGTFSLIHPGHLEYLKQARELGDHLTVIITTDKNVEKEKGRKPALTQDERLKVLSSLQTVDEAIIGSDNDFFQPIKQIKPSVIALGYDGRCDEQELEQNLKKQGLNTKVVRLPKHGNYSSSKILKK